MKTTIEKTLFICRLQLLIAFVVLASSLSLHATTFTWTTLVSGNASGSWTNTANWSGTLPTTSSDTADFSTLNITANSVVGITNGNVTININSMIFGDTDTSSAANWTLTASGNTQTITLGGSNPTITVNTLGTGASVTNNVVMAGSGFLKDGPGQLTLGGSGANTFTGTTYVTNGTLVLAKSDNIAAISSDLIVGTNGTVTATKQSQLAPTANLTIYGTFNTGGKTLTVNSLILDNNAQLLGSSSAVFLTNATTYDLRSGTVAPNLTGAAGLTKTTSGTVYLSNGGGSNTFAGPVLISDGILSLNHSGTGNGLPNVPITVTNTGVLQLQHDTELNQASTVNIDSGTFELAAHNDTASVIILDHGGMILNSNNTSKTLTINTAMDFRSGLCASVLGGTGTLTKSTAGTVILTMDNSYTGGTLISAGILQLGDGSSTNRGKLGTGLITNNAALVLNHSGAFTISNNISGSGAVTNLGGSPSLVGTNTYSGGTVVSGGTLFVNTLTGTGSGTGSGAVTVQSGAGLGGAGSIGGTVNIQSGGKLVPGNGGIGTLAIGGSLTLIANSTNTFDVNGTTPANDSVALSSSVTYGGVLAITPAGTFTPGQQFVLFSGTGATNTGNFSSLTGSPGANMAFTFTNGVLSVVSTGSPTATITNSVSGGKLTLTWPAGQGWTLTSQTNSLSTGLNTNAAAWSAVPGGIDGSNQITIDPTKPTVFFRLSQ